MNFKMKIQILISNIAGKIAKVISKVCRPEAVIDDEMFKQLKAQLRNGDCLVTRTDWEFSNWVEKVLTGSFYGHAAIYLNGVIFEATTKGVREISLERFCFMRDGIGLARLPGPDWTEDQISKMEKFCIEQMGEPYDFSFSWATDAKWYCSKYVLNAWRMGGAEDATAILAVQMLGQPRILPEDIWNKTHQIAKYGRHK